MTTRLRNALDFQHASAWTELPPAASLRVKMLAADADCSATAIEEASVDAPVEAGAAYTLGVFHGGGDGATVVARLWREQDTSATKALRVLNTMHMSYGGLNVSMHTTDGRDLTTYDLRPGALATGAAFSALGYVDVSGDLQSLFEEQAHGGPIASFLSGAKLGATTTIFLTGVPRGGPVAPQMVVCHDDDVASGETRCEAFAP